MNEIYILFRGISCFLKMAPLMILVVLFCCAVVLPFGLLGLLLGLNPDHVMMGVLALYCIRTIGSTAPSKDSKHAS